MNKYTYLLSDSYRNSTHIDSQTFKVSLSHPHQRPYTSKHPPKSQPAYSVSHNPRLEKLKQEYEAFQPKKMPNHLHLNDLQHNQVQLRIKGSQASREWQNPGEGDTLEARLKKLVSLGHRHEEALKQVELQSKLKKISDKYAVKQANRIEGSYQQYKRERVQSATTHLNEQARRRTGFSVPARQQYQIYREISFNKLPQYQEPIKASQPRILGEQCSNTKIQEKSFTYAPKFVPPQNQITRHSVKNMIANHLNQTKAQRLLDNSQIENRGVRRNQDTRVETSVKKRNIQHAVIGTGSSDQNSRSMQKLSNLQERIKSSIKPYLNI